jgi:microcystin-dependent protein
MTQAFVGQIEIFSFNFAPRGWQQCNGQILSIQQNQAVFALLGTTYGGNGVQTFALPDLRSRVPLGYGTGAGGAYVMGEVSGEEKHTLLYNEMPLHNHRLMADASTPGAQSVNSPSNSTVLGVGAGVQTDPAGSFAVQPYNTGAPNVQLAPQSISNTNGGVAHENRMPYLVLNFCIALQGIFPSRN